MPTNSTLSTQNLPISLPVPAFIQYIKRASAAVRTPAGIRFAKIAGMSFALALPALGILDPKVLLASGLSDAHAMEALLSRADVALRNMAVMDLFATGGVAVLALAAMAGAGYLRTRNKASGRSDSAAE